MQVDVGFGDSLAAPAVEISFPSLLGMPPPLLRAYRMETTVAEKFDAMLSLGFLNSRMKDYFDIWFLSKHFAFNGAQLAASIQATCTRRGHVLQPSAPVGLTEEFWNDTSRQAVWNAFWKKSVRLDPKLPLQEVVTFAGGFLLPPMLAAAKLPGTSCFSAGWRSCGNNRSQNGVQHPAALPASGRIYPTLTSRAEKSEALSRGCSWPPASNPRYIAQWAFWISLSSAHEGSHLQQPVHQ